MAIPQCANAHFGSRFATCSKPARACGYVMWWSSATARLKSACTAGAHDTGNRTVPNAALSCVSCWAPASAGDAANPIAASVERNDEPTINAPSSRPFTMPCCPSESQSSSVLTPLEAVSYTHLRAHETPEHLVCRLLL